MTEKEAERGTPVFSSVCLKDRLKAGQTGLGDSNTALK